jgi:endonuclease/exonuclease/phosphatase family metal-dependent hydrolase
LALGSTIGAIGLTLVVVMVQVLRLRGGLGGLVAILTPHLLMAAAAFALLAMVLARSRLVLISSVAILTVGAVTLAPEWVSLPAGHPAPTIRVMTWNLELGSEAAERLPAVLKATEADIVALQEVTPEAATAIENDPELVDRFPHRLLWPDRGVLGLGLLSRLPMTAGDRRAVPPIAWVTVTLDDGNLLRVLNAHPLPGRIAIVSPLRLPVGFDPTERDQQLQAVRAIANELEAPGDPVVLLGDLNVASTEPAYDDIVRDWRDAHAEAGVGPGWTWRPSRLEGLGIGVLRIDFVLVTPDVRPVGIAQDCSQPGDHCAVAAGLWVP